MHNLPLLLGWFGVLGFGHLGEIPLLNSNTIQFSARSIPDGSANGTTLGTASLFGPYTGTPVYSLSDPSGTFQINSSTGVVTVLDNTGLNADTNPTIPITISVSGTTPAFPPLAVTVLVTKAPVNSIAPVISGSAIYPDILSVSNGTWSANPAPAFTYQWKRGGSPIAGATNSTYTLQLADVGSTITCTVTATNSSGSASATSSATATVTKTTISYSPVTSATVGIPYTGATPSTSGGTSPYSYSVTNLPAWASFNTSTGVITGTPAGAEVDSGIIVTATDAHGVSSSSSPFTVTVTVPGSVALQGAFASPGAEPWVFW